MKNSKNSKHSIHRRDFIKGSAAASLGITSGLLGVPNAFGQSSNPSTEPVLSLTKGSGQRANAIQLENAKPGTRDWVLTNTYIDPDTWWRSPRIEGYCSQTSVKAGDILKVMVSTNPVSEHRLYEATGMKKGDRIKGLIGWEWHGNPALDLPGLKIVAQGTPVRADGKPRLLTHSATFYDGPKGNIIFNAGTIWWAQGLSSPPGHVLPGKTRGPDQRVQRIMVNVFDRFIK